MENIPKKYGGNLDWQFGETPNLEPAIANSLSWKENFEQKGHRTLPIGPIKWQYDEKGDLVATAIGTENDKPRKRVIAQLHDEESGVARLSLSPGRAEEKPLFQTTSAQIPAVHDTTRATSQMAEDDKPNMNGSTAPASSRFGVPTSAATPQSTDSAAPRQGTSSTRYEQQVDTHAHGQAADATPEVKIDSQGEKQGIMEPNTVGQAPKEHPMKIPEPEEPQVSYMDQAKEMAGHAVEQAKHLPATVMSAVGMGGAKEAEIQPPHVKKEDPAVDAMSGANVEEFLRSQTMSKR